TVGYSESDVGVHINLGNLLLGLLGAWGGDADGDVLVNGFENVVGSAHADDITGDAGANILVGLEDADRLDGSGGDDTLIGGFGADALIGDRGSDTASYALANAGVKVSLSTGTGTAGEAAGDTLTGIENLTGSAFADVLEGSALANRILAGRQHHRRRDRLRLRKLHQRGECPWRHRRRRDERRPRQLIVCLGDVGRDRRRDQRISGRRRRSRR
ncbi:hypothetical protein KXR53_33655, partial [Inquilinus limosus]|uniref:calcium-binding protein n=1 Tax=Inquilinus limosus TaxID=171674 RepID=UPI003F1802A2